MSEYDILTSGISTPKQILLTILCNRTDYSLKADTAVRTIIKESNDLELKRRK